MKSRDQSIQEFERLERGAKLKADELYKEMHLNVWGKLFAKHVIKTVMILAYLYGAREAISIIGEEEERWVNQTKT